MTRQPIVSTSLLNHTTATVQSRKTHHIPEHRNNKSTADHGSTSIKRGSQNVSSPVGPSSDSSKASSPFFERKHVQFQEEIEQLAATDIEGDKCDAFDQDHEDDDSDSDGGMRTEHVGKKRKRSQSFRRSNTFATACGETTDRMALTRGEDISEPRETISEHSAFLPSHGKSSQLELFLAKIWTKTTSLLMEV